MYLIQVIYTCIFNKLNSIIYIYSVCISVHGSEFSHSVHSHCRCIRGETVCSLATISGGPILIPGSFSLVSEWVEAIHTLLLRNAAGLYGTCMSVAKLT